MLVLALCGTAVSLMQTLVVPLLPDFPRLLGTTADNASWLVTVTLLTAPWRPRSCPAWPTCTASAG